jgi:hypothetical protein
MRGHFRYLRFKTFPMSLRTPQCKVFWALLSSSKRSGVPEDSKSSTFPSVGLHPHTWPKWGCDNVGHHQLVHFPIVNKCKCFCMDHLLHQYCFLAIFFLGLNHLFSWMIEIPEDNRIVNEIMF